MPQSAGVISIQGFGEPFTSLVTDVIRKEGGYVNHPLDRGGETKYGITKRNYPHLDIRSLTTQQAAQIYYDDYWKANGLDLHYPSEIQGYAFDCFVNHGRKTFGKILQYALNDCGHDLIVDGIIGVKTIKALREQNDSRYFLLQLKIRRIYMYGLIVVSNPSQLVFLLGWLKRAL